MNVKGDSRGGNKKGESRREEEGEREREVRGGEEGGGGCKGPEHPGQHRKGVVSLSRNPPTPTSAVYHKSSSSFTRKKSPGLREKKKKNESRNKINTMRLFPSPVNKNILSIFKIYTDS